MIAQIFSLGRIAANSDLMDALHAADPERAPESVVFDLVQRHMAGDWGDMDEVDCEANELALELELRVVSTFTTDKGVRLSITTKWDRSHTITSLDGGY